MMQISLTIATRIARKYAVGRGLPWQTLYGPAFEAVLAAQKSWRPGGKSLESWAEGYLRATIRKERGCHKVFGGHKVKYVSLDQTLDDNDSDIMSNHELVGDEGEAAREIEEVVEEREAREKLRDVSPRLRAVVEMLGKGYTLGETGEKLGGYTPARVKQLQGKIAAGLREKATEGPQLRLF